MKIGITQSETNYQNYIKWIKGIDAIEIIELSYNTYNIGEVQNCDGVVLTGGVDIKPTNCNYPNAPTEFNVTRDNFEKEVLSKALENKTPILGVCRGMQLINIHFGGDLFLDLGDANDDHKKGLADKIHTINVDEYSKFYKIVGDKIGEVNSAHHQAIDILAKGLRASAFAKDNTIEAIEIVNDSSQFLIAVQWHPERMTDQNSPFTKNIRAAFLKACEGSINLGLGLLGHIKTNK